jgi:membrane protease YdiL (CAAX protease family)
MGIGIFLCLAIVIGVIAQAAGARLSKPPPSVNLIENFVFDVSFVAAASFLAFVHGRAKPADFGFRRARLGRAIGAFVVAAIGYYVVSAVYATLLHLHGTDKLPKEFGVNKSTAALIGTAVFVCVLAPIVEEFFFRGFVFGALRRWRVRIARCDVGVVLAAIVTGIFFGAVHATSASPQYLVPLGFLGFVLCLVRWRTGSLYPCMALHSFNNSLALGVNALHWTVGPIVALIVGSLAVIGFISGPLGASTPSISPAKPHRPSG